jgi:hypothetical protein
MAENRTRSPIPESLPTDVVGPYAITELIAMDQAFVAAVVRAIKAGGRERGGGKRDGADRALASYFVPLPPCRHTSAGLLAHLLGRPLDPDAERSAQSSGRTSSARLSALARPDHLVKV